MGDEDEPCLITLDAPLGWPKKFAENLLFHCAGEKITSDPNEIFRRSTDSFVEKNYKKPLEVGANLIARTAHSALNLIGMLRAESNRPIPLAWALEAIVSTTAIEVYPAATLIAHAIHIPRDSTKVEKLRIKSDWIRTKSNIDEDLFSRIEISDHIVDSVICVIAGADFARGNSHPPEDIELAITEGWIWVKIKEA